MKKTVYLWSVFTVLLVSGIAIAQLPANPWDTAEFDAAVEANAVADVVAASATTSTTQETAGADVGNITASDDRVYIPSIKYKAINTIIAVPLLIPKSSQSPILYLLKLTNVIVFYL